MKEYRQDSHTAPLVVWAVLCMLTALLLFAHASAFRSFRIWEGLAAVGFLIVGPLGLAVYIVRARHVWVSVVAEGILVSGKHLLPWRDVVRIERRRPRLRPGSGPAKTPDDISLPVDGSGCLVPEWGALGAALGLLLLALAIVWAVVAVVIPLLIVPVLEIYAPFGDRVRIHRRRGRPITLRDLRDADDLVARLDRRGA